MIVSEINLENLDFLESICFGKTKYPKDELENILNNSLYKIIAYKEDNDYLGYVIYLDNGFEIEILKIGTNPNFRKKGIGTKIIDEIVKLNKEIFLEVRETNLNAISFYKKNNFKEIGRRKNYYADTKEDALIMKK